VALKEARRSRPVGGRPRVNGELVELGLAVSERAASWLMPRRRRPPSQSWRTFFRNHVSSRVALDFFTVPTLPGRVLFVLVVLAHERRRILQVNVTPHPTVWTRQQLREAVPMARVVVRPEVGVLHHRYGRCAA